MLRENFHAVQAYVGPRVIVCAVIKADAYGHGATPCALALEAAGAKWLGVTTTDEGMPLRSAGVRNRILLMTGFWRGEEEEVVRQNLTATVWEPWHVEVLNNAVQRLGAQELALEELGDGSRGGSNARDAERDVREARDEPAPKRALAAERATLRLLLAQHWS